MDRVDKIGLVVGNCIFWPTMFIPGVNVVSLCIVTALAGVSAHEVSQNRDAKRDAVIDDILAD